MAREPARRRNSVPPAPQIAVERELFLRSIAISQPLGGEAHVLARAMRNASFRPGEVIYSVGDFTRLIHFVTDGEIELSSGGFATWRLAAPAILGILDVNQRRPYTRTATALTEVRALLLSEDDWTEALEEHFEFARGSILRVAGDLQRIHLSLSPGGGFAAPLPPGDHEPHVLNLQERTLALAAVSCFRHAPIQPLALLAAEAKEHVLAAGQPLFSRGDRSRSIFVVARGTIRIEREEPKIRARFGPGSIVGGSAAIAFVTQEYSAEAETAATLLEIASEDLVDALEDHVEMIRAMLFGLGTDREQIMREHAQLTLVPRISAVDVR